MFNSIGISVNRDLTSIDMCCLNGCSPQFVYENLCQGTPKYNGKAFNKHTKEGGTTKDPQTTITSKTTSTTGELWPKNDSIIKL